MSSEKSPAERQNVAARHDAQQILESAHRLAEAAITDTRLVIEKYKMASEAANDAADKVRLAAELVKMMAAQRREELQAAEGLEAGPH